MPTLEQHQRSIDYGFDQQSRFERAVRQLLPTIGNRYTSAMSINRLSSLIYAEESCSALRYYPVDHDSSVITLANYRENMVHQLQCNDLADTVVLMTETVLDDEDHDYIAEQMTDWRLRNQPELYK